MADPNPFKTPTPEMLKEIPLSYFIGVGRKDYGIISVSFSPELGKMGGGKILEYIDQYTRYIGNRQSSSEIMDAKIKKIVEDVERKIKVITGFSVQELEAKKSKLNKQYRGIQEAPFLYKLF